MLRSQTLRTSDAVDYVSEFKQLMACFEREPGLAGFWQLFARFSRFDDGDHSGDAVLDTLLRIGGEIDDDQHFVRRRRNQPPEAWLQIAGLQTMRAIYAAGPTANEEHKGMAAAGALVCAATLPGTVGLDLVSRIASRVVRRLSGSGGTYLRRTLKNDAARKMAVSAILARWGRRRIPAVTFVPQPTKDFARALNRAGAYLEALIERVARDVLFETEVSRASHFRYKTAAKSAREDFTPAFIDAYKEQRRRNRSHEGSNGLLPIAAWARRKGTTRTTLTKGIALAVEAGKIAPPAPFQSAKLISESDADLAMSFVKQRSRGASRSKAAATVNAAVALALGLEPEEVTSTAQRLYQSGEITSTDLATPSDVRVLVEELQERHPGLRAAAAEPGPLEIDTLDAKHSWTRRREL